MYFFSYSKLVVLKLILKCFCTTLQCCFLPIYLACPPDAELPGAKIYFYFWLQDLPQCLAHSRMQVHLWQFALIKSTVNYSYKWGHRNADTVPVSCVSMISYPKRSWSTSRQKVDSCSFLMLPDLYSDFLSTMQTSLYSWKWAALTSALAFVT